MNIEKTLKKCKLNSEDFITILYTEEGEYVRFDLETKEGFCFPLELSGEDIVV